MKTPSRTFTLQNVLDRAQLLVSQRAAAMAGQNCDGDGSASHAPNDGPDWRRLKIPAMPTLKLWSKDGFFRPAHTLDEAAALVLDRIGSSNRFHGGPSSPGLQPGRDWSGNVQSPQPHAQNVQGAFREFGEMLALMQCVLSRLDDIEKRISAMESREQERSASTSGEGGQAVAFDKLAKALDRLDDTRKFLLLNADSQAQRSKQADIAGAGAGSFLDTQRLLGRMERLERAMQDGFQSLRP